VLGNFDSYAAKFGFMSCPQPGSQSLNQDLRAAMWEGVSAIGTRSVGKTSRLGVPAKPISKLSTFSLFRCHHAYAIDAAGKQCGKLRIRHVCSLQLNDLKNATENVSICHQKYICMRLYSKAISLLYLEVILMQAKSILCATKFLGIHSIDILNIPYFFSTISIISVVLLHTLADSVCSSVALFCVVGHKTSMCELGRCP